MSEDYKEYYDILSDIITTVGEAALNIPPTHRCTLIDNKTAVEAQGLGSTKGEAKKNAYELLLKKNKEYKENLKAEAAAKEIENQSENSKRAEQRRKKEEEKEKMRDEAKKRNAHLSSEERFKMFMIKLVVFILIAAVIIWFVFNIVLPLFIINMSLIALITALFAERRRTVLLWVSVLGMVFLYVDYNIGIMTKILVFSVSSLGGLLPIFLYINSIAGLVACYILIRNMLDKSAAPIPETGRNEFNKRNLIIISSLLLLGGTAIGLQRYFGHPKYLINLSSSARNQNTQLVPSNIVPQGISNQSNNIQQQEQQNNSMANKGVPDNRNTPPVVNNILTTAPQTINVPSNVDSVDSKLYVTAGQTINLTATGAVNSSLNSMDPSYGLVGPKGWAKNPTCNGGRRGLLGIDNPDRPFMALCIKIGTQPWQFAGNKNNFKVSQSGEIYLGVNDMMFDRYGIHQPNWRTDNTGSFIAVLADGTQNISNQDSNNTHQNADSSGRSDLVVVTWEYKCVSGTCTNYALVTHGGNQFILQGINYEGSKQILYREVYIRSSANFNQYYFNGQANGSYVLVDSDSTFSFNSSNRTCSFRRVKH